MLYECFHFVKRENVENVKLLVIVKNLISVNQNHKCADACMDLRAIICRQMWMQPYIGTYVHIICISWQDVDVGYT